MTTRDPPADLADLDGASLTAGFRAGTFDPVDAFEAAAQAIDLRNPALYAFVARDGRARAAAVERHSAHPVAKAIAGLDATRTASEVELHPGRGAVASVGGLRVAVGSRTLFATLGWDIPAELASRIADCRDGPPGDPGGP